MRKTAVFIILAVLIVCRPCFARAYSAKSMILIEKSTGTAIIEQNCDSRMPMASTTKIMTALVVLDKADLDAKVKIPAEAVGIEGSSMYLTVGETLTVRELLYGLMLTSGNDAATALAVFVSKTVDAFVSVMNEKASQLGLQNTHFSNPSGLPDDSHYTTARELAVITSHALDNETFAQIVSSESARVSYNDKPSGRLLKNHNKLLKLYDGTIGVKTGFTKKAGRCLVSAAERDGVTLICVTLNDGDDWNDHMAAFDSGFSKAHYVKLAAAGDVRIPLLTPDGKNVTAVNQNELSAVVLGDDSVTRAVFAEKFIYAPKSVGDCVGEVVFYCGNRVAARDKLVLADAIEAPPCRKELLITRIIRMIKNLFKDN